MSISRTFRKYNRTLLLVFMSLLLVVFLIGPVISRAVRSHTMIDPEFGQAFGKPVLASDLRMATDDTELVARLGIAPPRVLGPDERKRNIARYLLMEEARRAGIVISRDEIEKSFANNPNAARRLDIIHKSGSRSLEQIYDAVARVLGVQAYAEQQARAVLDASLPELEHQYQTFMQQARVVLSVIDSNALLDKVPAPTEEEIRANFEEGKNRETQHTEDKLVFGYRIPDRVAVEYLTVDPEAIKENVHISKKEVRRFYDEHKNLYVKKVTKESPFKLDDQQKPQTIQLTFAEALAQVRKDCREAKAIREAQSIVNQIYQEAARPWLTAAVGDDNKPRYPGLDQVTPFKQLADKYSDTYPVVYRRIDLATRERLAADRDFAQASAVLGGRPVAAIDLAFRVEGLVEAEKDDPVPVLHLGEPGPVVIRKRRVPGQPRPAPYQAYVFRVVQVAPAGPPASLDEVRDQVVANVKRIKAFEMARTLAEKLAARAREVGLKEAVKGDKELRALLGEGEDQPTSGPAASVARRYLRELEPFEPKRFGRWPTFIPNIGRSESLHKRVFEAVEQPAPEGGHRVVVVPVATSGKWVLAEPLEVEPIYRGDFESMIDKIELQVVRSKYFAFQSSWFDADNICKRTGFVPSPKKTGN